MSTVSHNVSEIYNSAKQYEEHASSYDVLIGNLYSLIEELTSDQVFKGGLSMEFKNDVLDKKQKFYSYSSTFRDAAEILNKRGHNIEDATMQMSSKIRNSSIL